MYYNNIFTASDDVEEKPELINDKYNDHSIKYWSKIKHFLLTNLYFWVVASKLEFEETFKS